MAQKKADMESRKWRVNSVGKALSILDCFTTTCTELNLAQISEKLSLPKSTTFNLVKTLMDSGYLTKSKVSQNYLLGMKAYELAYKVRSSLSIITYATPVMEEIMRTTGEICYLTAVYGEKILILEGVYPDRRFVPYSTAGKAQPMHCTSAGKAVLSYLPEEMVEKIIGGQNLEQRTINTIYDPDELRRELELTRRRGYSVDNEEDALGVRCVSLAIRDADGIAVGTISISGSVRSLTDEKIQQSLPLLGTAANFLAQRADLFPAAYPEVHEE